MTTDDFRREISDSRRAIQQDYTHLRAELDFAAKAKRAVVDRPLPWLGGAALFGYLLSGNRKRKAARNQRGKSAEIAKPAKGLTILGVLFAAIRLAFPLARPALTAFALRKLGGYAARFQP